MLIKEEVSRRFNKRWRTIYKHAVKNFTALSDLNSLRRLQSVLSRVPNHVIHRNKSARLLSRATRKLNGLSDAE